MIELLKRPEGATVEQIAETTGWQHHTIRGAISGALKKKLRLTSRPPAPARSAPTRRRQGQQTVYRISNPEQPREGSHEVHVP